MKFNLTSPHLAKSFEYGSNVSTKMLDDVLDILGKKEQSAAPGVAPMHNWKLMYLIQDEDAAQSRNSAMLFSGEVEFEDDAGDRSTRVFEYNMNSGKAKFNWLDG